MTDRLPLTRALEGSGIKSSADRDLRRASRRYKRGLVPMNKIAVALLLCLVSASWSHAAEDDTYLLCKGSIVTYLVNGQEPSRDEELAVHIESDKVNISGTSISGTNMQICGKISDKIDFYNQSCNEVPESYVNRTYGLFNKITGNLVVTVTPSRSFNMLQGKFVCRKTEPIRNRWVTQDPE
jgi:hypothetical protein